ncbi:MAG: 4-hydroxythreonine-4-phosphate dehydrogenase PdxA [Nitrososphaerota archaeon]|jgi:4-hydroxythreonine-4-phosphate dehydrogenase|nr:4-hydroxythreonine-4-phosphate dehydrogenase PdxA [Nitrososphaerota archaeon]MDG6930588.1 4-hydroxythreonine-4-phosphate dehydrogenase PdxA [Nitrososphaerota archaeon]
MIKIGVTMGDPAGVGYEISAKAIAKLKPGLGENKITLIGNLNQFRNVLKILKLREKDVMHEQNISFYDIEGKSVGFGEVQKEAGKISYNSFYEAIKLALDKEIDAIVTGPINKESWQAAGSKYIDHTTMLSELTNSKDVSTIFEVKKLRIIFLTKHMSLSDAVKFIKKGNVVKGIDSAVAAVKLLGIKRGFVAVAGLNPHSGEGGLFGNEEINEIIPAIKEYKHANKYGNIYGPIPADSVFHLASLGKYDIVLSLYHDQGHIAAKTYDFYKTVSLNLGAPFLRTSVDHGTAFDIAGKGIANEISMVEAIKKALRYAKIYRENYLKFSSQ